jgi:hypothetical protein
MELSKRTPENPLKAKFAEHGPASVQKAYPSGAIMLPGGITCSGTKKAEARRTPARRR